MRMSKAIAAALILAAPSFVSVASAQTASECPVAGLLSTFGINSKGTFNVAPGGACLFPLRIEGFNRGFEHCAKTGKRSSGTTQHIHV